MRVRILRCQDASLALDSGVPIACADQAREMCSSEALMRGLTMQHDLVLTDTLRRAEQL